MFFIVIRPTLNCSATNFQQISQDASSNSSCHGGASQNATGSSLASLSKVNHVFQNPNVNDKGWWIWWRRRSYTTDDSEAENHAKNWRGSIVFWTHHSQTSFGLSAEWLRFFAQISSKQNIGAWLWETYGSMDGQANLMSASWHETPCKQTRVTAV